MLDFLQYDFMQRALLAAVLVGIAAPLVGVYIVQRRLALIGDGLGHVALTGVALGLLTSRSPVLVALVVSILGAVAIEVVRARARTSADIALALLFYGGIAGGVVLISKAPGGTASTLNAYLFGAITTTSAADLVVFGLLAVVIVVVTVGLSRELFAVANDEDFARASGMPVTGLNILLASLTAATVVLSMRVVGLLLISALMVVPVATATLVSHSFRGTLILAVAIGLAVAVSGVALSYSWDTPSGGTIVLLAIALFGVTAVGAPLVGAARRRTSAVRA
jgi:zinc transport system permease protein